MIVRDVYKPAPQHELDIIHTPPPPLAVGCSARPFSCWLVNIAVRTSSETRRGARAAEGPGHVYTHHTLGRTRAGGQQAVRTGTPPLPQPVAVAMTAEKNKSRNSDCSILLTLVASRGKHAGGRQGAGGSDPKQRRRQPTHCVRGNVSKKKRISDCRVWGDDFETRLGAYAGRGWRNRHPVRVGRGGSAGTRCVAVAGGDAGLDIGSSRLYARGSQPIHPATDVADSTAPRGWIRAPRARNAGGVGSSATRAVDGSRQILRLLSPPCNAGWQTYACTHRSIMGWRRRVTGAGTCLLRPRNCAAIQSVDIRSLSVRCADAFSTVARPRPHVQQPPRGERGRRREWLDARLTALRRLCSDGRWDAEDCHLSLQPSNPPAHLRSELTRSRPRSSRRPHHYAKRDRPTLQGVHASRSPVG